MVMTGSEHVLGSHDNNTIWLLGVFIRTRETFNVRMSKMISTVMKLTAASSKFNCHNSIHHNTKLSVTGPVLIFILTFIFSEACGSVVG
jgi:hypothetical protein